MRKVGCSYKNLITFWNMSLQMSSKGFKIERKWFAPFKCLRIINDICLLWTEIAVIARQIWLHYRMPIIMFTSVNIDTFLSNLPLSAVLWWNYECHPEALQQQSFAVVPSERVQMSFLLISSYCQHAMCRWPGVLTHCLDTIAGI